jgi:hypothetical protein
MSRTAAALIACVLGGCAGTPAVVNMLGESGDATPSMTGPAPSRARGAPARAASDSYYATELRSAYMAFASGDYERAMLGYERVVGRAEEPRIQIRALICLAMIRTLPSSKMHDAVAASVILDELERRIEASGLRYEFFGELELLELVVKQDAALLAERANTTRLRKDLAARDAVIKKLRALSVETQ